MPCPPCYVPWCSPVKWVLLFPLLSHSTPHILPAAVDMCVLGLSSLVSWKNLESMDYLLQVYSLCVHAKLLQSSLTLFDPMDCSPPGSSVHGILQARILEWVAMPSSRGSSQPRNQNFVSCDSCIAGGFFTTEPPGKPISSVQLSCSVMSDSLQPHGRHHARLPCQSPAPGACSNSCPLSR